MEKVQVVKVSPENVHSDQDDKLKNGPINERECRDILCCLLFIGALVVCTYFFAFGLANGKPSRLFAVYDMAGNPCGVDKQESRKYLYFYTPVSGYFKQTTCVDKCPTAADTTSNCDTTSMTTGTCTKNNCSTISLASSLSSQTICYYETASFLGKICAPTTAALATFSSGAESAMSAYMSSSTLTEWFNDIKDAKDIIGASFGMAFVLGFLYMVFLRFFAGLLVWIAIIAYFAGIIVLGVLCLNKSTEISDYLAAHNNVESGSNTVNNQNSYKYIAYILFVFAGLCFIVFLCLRTKIRQAIAIIKTTSQFVRDVWTAMFVPPLFIVVVAAWWIMWLYGYVYLYAVDESGTIQKSSTSIFADVKHSQLVQRVLWAYFFVGLWVNAFIQAVCQFVLASAACIWYFSHGEEGQKHAPVRTSLYRAFRYHIGSLAFGSLILAIIQFVRVILAYMEYQMNKAGGNNNALVKFLLKCMQCYLACFERFIKFLNKNAYIQIALKGQNFCVAAKDALSVIWSNADRFALVNGIGGAFIFLGKLFITCLTTFFCYLILTRVEPYKSEVSSYILPCLIIFFIGYAISVVFMCVYGMGMQAILMCFLWDEKMYQNSTPPHAPPLLQEFFEKEEKK